MTENKVELLGIYGSDKTHALSAWTSTFSELNIEMPAIDERIDEIFDYMSKSKKKSYVDLLKQLAWNHHETPFEKSSIHFLVTTDIATHIQIIKHRIGVSVNSESARYKELQEDKFYIPQDWPDKWQKMLESYTIDGLDLYHKAIKELEEFGLSRKRAKESARFFRPYNTQITQDVMFNFRSFMHFVMLRDEEHAQDEIRQIAKDMLFHVEDSGVFKYSLQAYAPVIKFLQMQDQIIEFIETNNLTKEDFK